MDIMVGLPGGRKLLLVLASQVLALFISLLATLAMIYSEGGSGISAANTSAFLLPLAVMATIGMTLTALSEPIELLLSIKAKRRLRQWVLPALLAGAGISAIAFVYYCFAPSKSLMYLSTTLAYLIPIAALSLFAVGAGKRYLAMTKGAAEMLALLSDGSEPSSADDGLQRIRSSIATEMGTATTNVRPNPQGFTLSGITSRPYHNPRDFDWMRAFEERFSEIKAEADTVLNAHRNKVDVYKYPGLNGDQWKAFKFVARHQPVEQNMQVSPVTASLLKTIPGFPIFRDAMFSILAPGGEIARHRDIANVFLTAHFGLSTPPNCFLEVAGERREWSESEFLVFDSSYEHRAVNNSSEPRIVLLIDFLHPEITSAERDWIKQVGL